MKIVLPELAVVALIGPSGSGKSTFARKHFKPTEVLSSDFCRGLVSDDENNQSATDDAFDVLHYIAGKRLAAGKLVVVDATNVQREARKPIVSIAREYHCIPVAIVLNLPEKLCHERNKDRSDRSFGSHVVRQQRQQLRRSLKSLKREGFRHIYILESPEHAEDATLERQRMWNNLKHEHGPFDIIGDVHGCYDELIELLEQLGYSVTSDDAGPTVAAPDGRKLVFVGDLVDRGPKIPDVLRLVMKLVEESLAICVPGNHDIKLMRKLRGRDVQLQHGLAESVRQLDSETEEFRERVAEFIDSLISHYVFDDGKLVVAHAGMKEHYQGRGSGRIREFALYGETTGETDEFGLPIRFNWAAEYRGKAIVVYGHTPVPETEWLNNTINIDTGCVFGGKLTAVRYPERETVSVPARKTYSDPIRPLVGAAPSDSLSSQQMHDDILDIEDVMGKRIISTRLRQNVTIREENGTAALEVISRFAVNPKWLIYLPPTMAPTETSSRDAFLESPEEAFGYFERQNLAQVICEEKHMGSRAVVIVCRDAESATEAFGVTDDIAGACFTRTGRRFLNDDALENELLTRIRTVLTSAKFWEEFETDWVCFDCELMPWSAKAQELLRQQYAAVGAASHASLPAVIDALRQAEDRDVALNGLLAKFQNRNETSRKFVTAYRHYCWPVTSVADYKLAPFHILATEGKVHVDQNHEWHMKTISQLCAQDPEVLLATPYKKVDLADKSSQREATKWWEELTSRGGEGMVVKPLEFIANGKRGLVQPAVKCRGREYLRIIYGPEYTLPENLERLRARGLSRKRSLALREFALGVAALERFARKEPLRRVHECVFGVLALESEPVDPRL